MLTRKKLRDRFILLSALLSMMLIAISGCSSDPSVSVSTFYEPTDGEFVSHFKAEATDAGNESLEDAIEKGKTILTLQDLAEGSGIGMIVKSFNSDNDRYHVEIAVFEDAERNSGRDRLKMELVSGKGPDIMTRFAIWDAPEIMNKGCFVDLAPLMEQSGFSDALFFPCYKSLRDGEKVYCVTPGQAVESRVVKKDVIEGEEITSFERFVDCLLSYPKDAVLMNDTQKPDKILEYFIGDSETVWGMIDWDNLTCDFTGELFSKILDVVKRYSDSRGKGYEPIMKRKEIMPGFALGNDAYEKEGWVTVDYWFDSGRYPKATIPQDGLLINANTENLEGAWAFVSYAMSVNGQCYESLTPTLRSIYDTSYEDIRQIAGPEDAEKYYSMTIINEYKDALERGKYSPDKTEPILDIIYEESGAYFAGEKTKEEVIELIQNRVALFLAEQK